MPTAMHLPSIFPLLAIILVLERNLVCCRMIEKYFWPLYHDVANVT